MATIFDGKKRAEEIQQEVSQELERIGPKKPSLLIIRVGNDAPQVKFTERKRKVAQELGFKCDIYELPGTSENEIINVIHHGGRTSTGILVQLPLPSSLNKYNILNEIPYSQDVEGLSAARMGLAMQEIPEIYSPVAMAAVDALMASNVDATGKKVVMVGNSYFITRPLVHILSAMGATVTICNSKTKNLSTVTQMADVIIAGAGKPDLIKPDDVKEGVIAIDTGFEMDNEGKIHGDFHPDVANKASFFTPVPGGIGPLTVAYIFKNLLTLCKEKHEDRRAHNS